MTEVVIKILCCLFVEMLGSEEKGHKKFPCSSQRPERMKEFFIESECKQQALVLGKKDYWSKGNVCSFHRDENAVKWV